jgi:hypothetical protein
VSAGKDLLAEVGLAPEEVEEMVAGRTRATLAAMRAASSRMADVQTAARSSSRSAKCR